MAANETSQRRWSNIPLMTGGQDHADLLNLDGKTDATTLERALVRGDRFVDSYMIATNGGSTFEAAVRRAPGPPPTRSAPMRSRAMPARIALQNVIGGHDEREPILDTAAIPARSVGLLRIQPTVGEERWGTAWMIGPRTLATAAHNLVHPEAGPTRRLDVALAYDGNKARGGWHHIVDNRLPDAWQDAPEVGSAWDFAVIMIADPQIGNSLGWFGFADYEDAKFRDLAVNLYGYPMDLDQFVMYGSPGRVLEVDDRRIRHDCDSCGGMSGGPLFAKFGDRRIAVGIHVNGGGDGNWATRITAEAHALFTEFRGT